MRRSLVDLVDLPISYLLPCSYNFGDYVLPIMSALSLLHCVLGKLNEEVNFKSSRAFLAFSARKYLFGSEATLISLP